MKIPTLISFKPDLSIFTDIVEFDFEETIPGLAKLGISNAGPRIAIVDLRGSEPHLRSTCTKGDYLNT